VKIDALKADLNAEQGEVLATGLLGAISGTAGLVAQDVQFQKEENNWKKYDQLELANLLRQRAESAYQAQAATTTAAPGSVAARMLALNSYGQQPAPSRVFQPQSSYGPPRPSFGQPLSAYGPG